MASEKIEREEEEFLQRIMEAERLKKKYGIKQSGNGRHNARARRSRNTANTIIADKVIHFAERGELREDNEDTRIERQRRRQMQEEAKLKEKYLRMLNKKKS